MTREWVGRLASRDANKRACADPDTHQGSHAGTASDSATAEDAKVRGLLCASKPARVPPTRAATQRTFNAFRRAAGPPPRKDDRLFESMFTLRDLDLGYECAHCDYLISWHRASRLRRRFRRGWAFPGAHHFADAVRPVPCGWCWRMI